MKHLKLFENNENENPLYEFSIGELIDYFSELEKTDRFLEKLICQPLQRKRISIKDRYYNRIFTSITVYYHIIDNVNYEFIIDSNIAYIRLKNDDIIYIYDEISDDLQKILLDIKIKKYNL